MADSWMYQSNTAGSSDQSRGITPDSSAVYNSPPGVSSDTRGHPPRIRRRNRQITSCLECRRRKLKCDKQAPCTNCTRFRRDCLYLAPALDPQSMQKLADIKEKMGSLEKTLERDVARKPSSGAGDAVSSASVPPAVPKLEESDEDELSEAEDEKGLEPTPLASIDNVYEDGADDELMDLGVQLGKLRISERIGGWVRPKLVEELNDTLNDVRGGRSRWSETKGADHAPNQPPLPQSAASPKSFLGPGPDYIAPASSFFFPGTLNNSTLIDYLPTKAAADKLISQYFLAVHQIAKIVHKPSFEAQYASFWNQISVGKEPPPSQQSVIFAAMFSATVSMSNEQVMLSFGAPRATLLDSLRSGTEMALSRANFLRTTKVDTMQAFVMYLIPLCRSEVSRAHSALTGTAIRLAECMGLHRDPTNYSIGPVETQVRRMIWYQLCFLDMRTCEAIGPRPQIRKEDYDTKFPLNVNDTDLLSPSPPTVDSPHWTDMTLSRVRMECIEMHRQIWFDLPRVDRKKISLTATLGKVQKFRAALEKWFYPTIDYAIPIQALAKHVYDLLANRCYVQILHRYLYSVATRLPDRLRQIVIEGGLTQMEAAVIIETKEKFGPWAWYSGAYQQYHSALLLLIEVYAFPMRKDAGRIWKALDYIFDLRPEHSPKQKAESVIRDLRDRMELYQNMRKQKATTHMEQRWNVQNLHLAEMDQMPQDPATAFGNMPTIDFSPPPLANTESSGSPSESRQGSVAGGSADTQMQTIADIDWAEWDKYFSPETNTGDINIPDFNLEDFTGGNLGPADFAPQNFTIPQASDLEDVNFPHIFYPDQHYQLPPSQL